MRLTGLIAVATLALCSTAAPGRADDTTPLQGLWRLVSYEIESQATGRKATPMGEHPGGYAIFTTEGRVFFMFSAEGRKPGKSDAERAALLDTLIAYTGTYRVEGDQWITHVDTAWNPEWVGTVQSRTFKRNGNRLQILTPWRVMPNWRDKGTTRSIVTFERAQ